MLAMAAHHPACPAQVVDTITTFGNRNWRYIIIDPSSIKRDGSRGILDNHRDSALLESYCVSTDLFKIGRALRTDAVIKSVLVGNVNCFLAACIKTAGRRFYYTIALRTAFPLRLQREWF